MSTVEVPKYLTISREIESRINLGRLGDGKLPSSRQIAEEHGVSIVTASRALQILRDKGLIRTVDRSGSYITRPESPPPTDSTTWAMCIRASPGPWYHASVAVTRSGFDALAVRFPGLRIDVESLNFPEPPPADELKRRVVSARDAGISGVFMLPSRRSRETAREDEVILNAFRTEGMPVVLLERNLRSHARLLEHDLVSVDDLGGGFRCTRHLLDSGRKRVAFITGSPTSSHDDRMAGYFSAIHQDSVASGRAFAPIVIEEPPDLPRKAAYQELAARVLSEAIDGLVCYQDYTAIGVIMELLIRGASVPDDVAITGFDDLPIGNSFAIGVTTYGFPSEAVAREAIRLIQRRIEEPDAAPIHVSVPGKLIVRESSGSHSEKGSKDRQRKGRR